MKSKPDTDEQKAPSNSNEGDNENESAIGASILHRFLKETSQLFLLLIDLFTKVGRKHQYTPLWDRAFDQVFNMLGLKAEMFETSGLISQFDKKFRDRLTQDLASALLFAVGNILTED